LAVKIRLKRMGAKKKPFYRIVVVDSRTRRDGKEIDRIGHYNPVSDPVDIKIDQGKAVDWINKGAQCTEVVKTLFHKSGVFKAQEN
jgi:small subunit ribosomal protein S16